MKVTRRDLLMWGAGAAAGFMVTPVPWKVLDDVSIWSQNWSWIPQPNHGPVEVKQSFCSLCRNGCGLRVRMAGGYPVGIAGMETHPLTRGALCPLAFGAHQLNWHPQRLRTVRHRNVNSSWDEARASFAKACGEGSLVVIDGHPGRAASSVLESFAQKHGGNYRVVPCPESQALDSYEAWTGVPASSLGYDLENTKTILSFGAPLLDGWGMPGRFTRLWAERAAGQSDPQLRVIQAESSLSRTAARAWQWAQIREGGEFALASGLARVLLEQNLVPAHALVPAMTLSEAAQASGFTIEQIENLARTLIEETPVVAIAANDNPSVAALNLLLGAVGTKGGIVRRSKNAPRLVAAEAEISNARAVLIDASVSWEFAPHTDAEVFRFAAWDGGPTKADWLLPAPGFLEELTDIPTAPTSVVETYAVAPSLSKPTADCMSAAQFLASIDTSLSPVDAVIHARCDDLFRQRLGAVHGSEITPLNKIASAKQLEEQLSKGAVWVGEPSTPEPLKCKLEAWPNETTAKRHEGWPSAWEVPVMPSLASKLYNESGLRTATSRRNG